MNNTTAKSSTKRQFKLPFGVHNWHKHPMVLPVTVFFVLFFMSIGMFVSAGATTIGADDVKVVTVSIDGEKQVVPTRARTVADLLERLEIEVRESDVIEPSLNAELEHDFRINIYTSRAVLIVDGEEKQLVDTAEPRPRDVVAEAGIELHPEDIIERDASEPIDAIDVLQEGVISERIIIQRATAVQLNLFGVDYELRTHAETVEELLFERGVDVANISVLPELDVRLSEEEAVFVTDPDKEIVMEEEEIPQDQEFVDDFDLLIGQTAVKEEGRPGRRVVVYEIAEDGSRTILQEVVVREPTTQVVARGRQAPQVVGDRAALMREAGIPESQLYYADFIIDRESTWRVNARSWNNCIGLGQNCPDARGNYWLVRACPNWENDPVCQLQRFNTYAQDRYGGWDNAFEFWQRNRWW
jgi:resuscitation-promoting factor RpfB